MMRQSYRPAQEPIGAYFIVLIEVDIMSPACHSQCALQYSDTNFALAVRSWEDLVQLAELVCLESRELYEERSKISNGYIGLTFDTKVEFRTRFVRQQCVQYFGHALSAPRLFELPHFGIL